MSPALKYQNNRQFDRVQVNLLGVAEFSTTSASLRVLDLSPGGARVEMPMHVSVYDFNRIHCLRIANTLHARVAWRWMRDRQAGLEFLSPTLVRAAVIELMDSAPP